MLKRFLTRFFYGACTIAALASCGDSKSAGTGEFATVYATANPPGTVLDSDVATWVGDACALGSVVTLSPDAAVYTITSTPYAVPNTGSSSPTVPSALVITAITLTLTPADTLSPALPARFQTQFPSSGQRITPGTNSVTVEIAPTELKSFFRNSLGMDCTNPNLEFSYRAYVSFEAREETTNKTSTITTEGFLKVRFSDFIDD